MLRELRVWQKHKGSNKGYTKWNEEKSTENREEKEAGVQINDLEHEEEINSHPEQKEETRIKNKQL